MKRVMPWKRLEARIAPVYPVGREWATALFVGNDVADSPHAAMVRVCSPLVSLVTGQYTIYFRHIIGNI